MERKKSLFILIMISLVIFISGSYIALDWSRFFIGPDGPIYTEYLYSGAAKLLVSLLCVVIVWMVGKDGVNSSDTGKMKLIFIAIFTADILFFLKFKIPGITIFGIAQILLAFRNGAGMWKLLSSGKFPEQKNVLLLTGLLIAITVLMLLSGIFYPLLKGSMMFYIISEYAILVSISLWIALANSGIGFFPKINSNLITAGMIFFFMCDINVGLSIALEQGIYRLFANSTVWVFYTPALILLALSGYNYKKIKTF